ncbi:MAG: ABC transporter ATP-binding protein [Lachnospiraceae bacterium]|nr:ABC transporter ATP-binding protein [Lachnospiraceae bacterium]
MIEINDVSFYYKEGLDACLDHVNLQINKGEVVVLCGESGCGKSTIIRLINGLIPFYYEGQLEGQVKVLGHSTQKGDIYDLGSKVSTVFQNPRSQFFCVDVKSELAFGAENLRFDKGEIIKRIEDTSHELKFEHLLDRTMFQLSGGEKQKIACASVSVTDNSIVVLDEPSSNLDMHAIAELKKMIQYWKQKGKTVVVAEHRLQYLQDMADRFVYMKKGKIVREFGEGEIQKLSARELTGMGLRNLSYDCLDIQNQREASAFMKINDFIFRYRGAKKASLSIDKLDIPKTSVIAIIGRNGAGKSTFVRCLCGLEKKAKGLLEDDNVKRKAKNRLNHSFLVMQDVNRQLFTESVEEEIILSMEEENQNLLEELLNEFDLYDYRKQHPMSLSGGQKQRVAVASAMASQRDYIIFDEPTSGLDYFHMQQVADCMKNLQEKGKTVFLITHDIELIYSCCNYVLQVENGTVRDLYQMNQENESRLRTFFRV